METIRRKILLEDFIIRDQVNWGQLSVSAFSINLFFTQDGDDMGIATDLEYIDYSGTTLPNPNPSEYSPNTRFPGQPHSYYFTNTAYATGLTENRLENVKSYNANLPYIPLFDINRGTYNDYQGISVNGVTRVISDNNQMPIVYTEDANVNDPNLGNPNQDWGILFKTYSGTPRSVTIINGQQALIPLTEIYYKAQGLNGSNTLLSASTKQEYLYGITSTPEVQSDVFIDRGRHTITQRHLQLGEIRTMGELTNYGNGYYKIQK